MIRTFIIATVLLSGCSSSNNTPVDTDSMTGGSTGGMTTDLVVYETDIYDPNNTITNACSSALWTSIAGKYAGTVEATGLTGGSICNYDVQVNLTRQYKPDTNRATCQLETSMNSTLTSSRDQSTGDEGMCQEVNATGLIDTEFTEPNLSTPEWPIHFAVELENDIDFTSDLLPFEPKAPSGGTNNIIDISFDGSGALTQRTIEFTSGGGVHVFMCSQLPN